MHAVKMWLMCLNPISSSFTDILAIDCTLLSRVVLIVIVSESIRNLQLTVSLNTIHRCASWIVVHSPILLPG